MFWRKTPERSASVGHVRGHGAADALSLTLIIGKDERPVLHEGAAEHAAVLIPPIVRFHRIALLEVVPGVQALVAKKLEHVAVNGIGARLRREIDHAAIEPPELGCRAVALDLELLDGVDDRIVRELPRLGLEHGDAVEEILVRSRSSAVDARQDGVRRKGDTRRDGGEHDEQAAVQRQLHDLFVLDDGPEARGLDSHDR